MDLALEPGCPNHVMDELDEEFAGMNKRKARNSCRTGASDDGIMTGTSLLHPVRVGTTIGASWLENYVHPRTAPRSSG